MKTEIEKKDTATKLERIRVTRGGVQLESMADMWTMANAIASAGFAPVGTHGKPMDAAQIMICIQTGAEVGLKPMASLRNIVPINNRPTIWGDALLALIQRTGELEDIVEEVRGEGDSLEAVCTIKRSTRASPTVRTFSVEDAKTAGLWGKRGPWQTHPKRMLQMRARGFAARDSFPDALGGLMLAEEAVDLDHEEHGGHETRRDQLLSALREVEDVSVEEDEEVLDAEVRIEASDFTDDELEEIKRRELAEAGLLDEEGGA